MIQFLAIIAINIFDICNALCFFLLKYITKIFFLIFNRQAVISSNYGPHGTPPMQTQPLYREYEYSDLLKGYNTAKQHENARKVI